jgi:hypothetical protein
VDAEPLTRRLMTGEAPSGLFVSSGRQILLGFDTSETSPMWMFASLGTTLDCDRYGWGRVGAPVCPLRTR